MLKPFAFVLALLVSASVHAQEKQHLKVLLDWFVNPNHAPLIVAQQIGAFDRQGLDVEIIAPSDPSTPPNLLAAGQADLALSYQPQLYLLVDQGLPVTRVATLIDSPLNTLTALADGPIHGMVDFKGHRIGYSVAGMEEVLIKSMLRHNGVDPAQVELVAVNFQQVPSLLSRQVDGAIGMYRNVEDLALQQQGATPRVFKPEENGIPAYDELIVLAAKAHAGDPRVARFVAALKEGVAYLQAHPDESWQAFAKAYPDLDDELDRASWRMTVPLFAKDPGAFDAARYQAFGEYLRQSGLIGVVKPIGDYGQRTGD